MNTVFRRSHPKKNPPYEKTLAEGMFKKTRWLQARESALLPETWVTRCIVWQLVQLLDELEYVIRQRFQRLGRP